MRDDELELVRGARPDVDPPSGEVTRAARARLAATGRPRRSPWRRAGLAVALASMIAVLVVGGASLLPQDRPGAPELAQAIEITGSDAKGWVVRFVDVTDASAADINRQLAAAGLDMHVHLVPASPSTVGTVAAVQQTPMGGIAADGSPAIGFSYFGNEFHGPFARTTEDGYGSSWMRTDRLEIEAGSSDPPHAEMRLDIWVGRPAREGEVFVLRRDSAERLGEQLHCVDVYNRRAGELADALAARDLDVVWLTEDRWLDHALVTNAMHEVDALDGRLRAPAIPDEYEAAMAEPRLASPRPPHADWFAWYSRPVAPGVVAVRIGPRPTSFREPLTLQRTASGIVTPEPVADSDGRTDTGFVRPPRGTGPMLRFVMAPNGDHFPELPCTDSESEFRNAIEVGPGSLSS